MEAAIDLKAQYREYLLGFLKGSLEEIIDCEILSIEEFIENYRENTSQSNCL